MDVSYKSDKFDEIEVIGVKINTLTIDKLNIIIANKVRHSEKIIIAHHNLHSVYLFHRNDEFKSFFELVKYVHADGMSLVTWAKILGNEISRNNRITYLDWINPLLQMADEQAMRIFYLGGEPGIAWQVIRKLKMKYANIRFQEHHGYFDVCDKSENNSVLKKINNFRPNILMVGMGMPRQEIWIKNNYKKINANVILPSGACFDYLAGKIKKPPRWVGNYNLEWAFRLADEPKRLFKRYCIEPVYLLPHLVNDVFKNRK